ncbi:MAG: bifunctional (p)ppGpp synthetase/guanosine-3',5'-bis(diphosphate) 3'-pyrophosphohydrolase [Clostridia bacterium]|nr:bifunctional (p)ppGpp synthetase/guanosine-3',5'-bis(diphosphate) 3'-pyrophosphohydrolase [Clostridia bacterium]
MAYKEPAEITIENLKSKIRHYYPNDTAIILRAFKLAQDAHEGQYRASGRPYITHPCVVCDILIDLGFDVATLCAALLHDTVEDTYVTDQQLRNEFGDEIANLVQGVTKLDKLQFASKEEEQAENIRKMFFAMAKDIRVIIIKLADRLHNMRSLHYLSERRQQAMAKETIDIFAPLAGRLGISQIKCELEDLCLKYLDEEAYEYLSENIAMKKEERQSLVDTVIFELSKMLKEIDVVGEISGRTKHFYSIYKKMKNQGKSLDEIYDMTAVRVIVNSVKDCYNVLGSIHATWKPLPGRIKDYIAVPKPNMYQSLHTTVITNLGSPFEIQIRTKEMHRVAEYGIAAHWKYKEGAFEKGVFDKISWIKEVVENDAEGHKDSKEFLASIKQDISVGNEVFVFTPKGAVKILQTGATALDFAYAVHSEVGHKCVGAKVNSKLVPIGHVLENGDIVEILTSANSKGPSRDWLKIVVSSSAKTKIKQFFKKELKDEHIKNGRSMLEKEAKRRGFNWSQLINPKALETVYRRYMFSEIDEMYASVGYGSLTTNQVLIKLIDYYKKHVEKVVIDGEVVYKPKQSSKANSVIIKGYDDLLIRFSKCCSPVPGDKIVGYISRGRGITIHLADCQAVKTLEKERLVEAEWSQEVTGASFSASLQVLCEDKGVVFADLTKIITNQNLPIISFNARKDKNHNIVAVFAVEIKDHRQLNQLIDKIRSYPNTLDVFRTTI